MTNSTNPYSMREYGYHDIYIDENADADRQTVLVVVADTFVRLTRREAEAVARKLSPDRRIIT